MAKKVTSSVYSGSPVALRRERDLVPHKEAEEAMTARALSIAAHESPEQVWFLEHPPLYTAGTSANPADLRDPQFPVFETGRGGQYTYHGPGQRVAYAMLDLRQRGRDVSAFVRGLEEWIIGTLADFDVIGERRCGRVGVWVVMPGGLEKKIAAIGVRLKKWVSFHGISINVDPDLSHFGGIVPCGLPEFGVTSLKDLGIKASMSDVDAALVRSFEKVFGPLKSQTVGGP